MIIYNQLLIIQMKNKVRIAKFLADCGIASRRKAEELILSGKVKIDDNIIKDVSINVDIDSNNIKVNDKLIKKEDKEYYILNKPKGYICSVSDPHNSKTVISLIKSNKKIVPVGRLDKDSQGLLLLTNDGDLVYKLTHPKFEVKKTYLVELDKNIEIDLINKLKKGVLLDEGLAKVDKIKKESNKKLLITIHQGWKRQIRRMLGHLGYGVINLTRVSEGKINLKDLPLGKFKKIKKSDIL